MRIATSTQAQWVTDQLSATSTRVAQLQAQVSSGLSFQQPSDNPSGAVQAADLQSSLSRVGQYTSNAKEATGWLTAEDSALGSMATLVQQAQTVALQGANATEAGNGAALADQIDAISKSLVGVGNTKVGSRALFAGFQTTGTPLTSGANGVTYHGDSGTIAVAVSDTEKVTLNTAGDQVFNFNGAANAGAPDLFTSLSKLSTALRAGDTAGISTGIAELSAHNTRLINLRADSGIRMQQTTMATDRLTQSQQTLTTMLSSTQDVDITQAIVQLTAEQNLMQAAGYVATHLTQGGLLNWLK